MHWSTTRFDLNLSQPLVMGIVNITPDSFSDGGHHGDTASALRHAEALLKAGAHILDLGGESTRPGSPPLPLEAERARVLPVLREVLGWGVPVSVDTYKSAFMQEALDLGADIINDIWALRQPGAEQVVAAHPRCGLCLMHMHREPQTMQATPMAGDVVPQVLDFLRQRVDCMQTLGVAHSRMVIDPGIGFGKTVAQNFALLARQPELLSIGLPVLAGWSRKSSLGAALQGAAEQPPPTGERVIASVAAAVLAVERGARIVRVHDVHETVQALAVWQHARP